MRRIITIGREFGSGGRELGKRLADALQIPCYDKEIIEESAKLHGLDPEHVERISEADIRAIYPRTIGRSLNAPITNQLNLEVAVTQQRIITSLASQSDCVIVGRGADGALESMSPLNLFVYADEESKVHRCLARSQKGEDRKTILKQMKSIDRNRAAFHSLLTSRQWGRKENYHLCINTSGQEIKKLVPGLAEYVRCWFEGRQLS